MYRIKLTAQAKKELKIIKKEYQEPIGAAIEEIKEDPFIGKPLTRDLLGKYSCKVGPFRIIYRVNRKDQIVLVLSAGHRATVYK